MIFHMSAVQSTARFKKMKPHFNKRSEIQRGPRLLLPLTDSTVEDYYNRGGEGGLTPLFFGEQIAMHVQLIK
jgi:hypothetical protein